MLCRICNGDKPEDQFYSGVTTRCKDCHKARMKMIRRTDPAVQERERNRAKRPERRAAAALNTKQWRSAHPEAYRAQNAVNNAVRDGKLVKEPCGICGTTQHVHAHHQDYSKPLAVKWLCAKCHHRIHAVFPELGGHHEAVQ